MRRAYAALATALAAALLWAATPANPADAHAVLATARQRVQAADFRASGHLVRVDASVIYRPLYCVEDVACHIQGRKYERELPLCQPRRPQAAVPIEPARRQTAAAK